MFSQDLLRKSHQVLNTTRSLHRATRNNHGQNNSQNRERVYGDNVFEKDGIRRDRTGDGEKTRCLCGKRGIFNRDGPAMGPQIIRQLE